MQYFIFSYMISLYIFSRPCRSHWLLYKQPCHSLINLFINSVSQPFPPTALQRPHAQMVRDTGCSAKVAPLNFPKCQIVEKIAEFQSGPPNLFEV